MRSRVNLDRPRRIECRFVDGQQQRFVEQFIDALQQFVERQFEFLGLLVQFLQLLEFLQLRVGGRVEFQLLKFVIQFWLICRLCTEYETLDDGRRRGRKIRAPPEFGARHETHPRSAMESCFAERETSPQKLPVAG